MFANNNNNASTQDILTERGRFVESVDFCDFINIELKAKQLGVPIIEFAKTLKFRLSLDPSSPRHPVTEILRNRCNKANYKKEYCSVGMYLDIISDPKNIYLDIFFTMELNKESLFYAISEITELSKNILKQAYQKEVDKLDSQGLLSEDQKQPVQHSPIPKKALENFFQTHAFSLSVNNFFTTSEDQHTVPDQSRSIYAVNFNEFIEKEIDRYFDESNQIPRENTFSFSLSTNYPKKGLVADDLRGRSFRKDITSFGFGLTISTKHGNIKHDNIKLEILDTYNKLNRNTLIKFMSKLTCLSEDELQIAYQCRYNEKMNERLASNKRSLEQIQIYDDTMGSSKAQKNTP